MSKTRMIGSSNQFTNNTCAFGSMAGLAPTTNVRPNITGIPGYYVTATAHSIKDGCGLGTTCANGRKCLKNMNLMGGANSLGGWRTGGGTRLLG